MLGRAKSVKVGKENTIVVDGAGSHEDIKSRIAQIKIQIEETTSDLIEKSFKKDLLNYLVVLQ